MALLFVQLFFGLFPVFIKLADSEHQGFQPRAMASWRMVFAALVLGVLVFAREGRRAVPALRDVPLFVTCALFGIVLNQVLALEGMVRTTVVDAGLLMTLIPVFTYLLAVLARQEVLRGRRALGIAVALGGALLLVSPAGASSGASSSRLSGNLMIIANCLSYAGYLVLARPLLARYSALCVIAWIFLCSLVSVPFLMVGQPVLPEENLPRVWGSMAYILLFPTVLAYLLNTYALARVSASTTAVFIYLQPFFASIGAWVVFRERLSPLALVAASLLFAGIWLVTTSRSVVRSEATAPPGSATSTGPR